MQARLDEVDGYLEEIRGSLPPNSMLGVVCFGRDSVIHVYSGGELKSVRDAKVDASGTDIASALDFTATLFGEGELKRIVLITDGCDTVSEGAVAASVERLVAKEIKIDTVYVDSNLKAEEREVQISSAQFTPSTYLGHESTLTLLLQANAESDVIVDLLLRRAGETDYVSIDTAVYTVDEGTTPITFTLPTDTEGTFDYKAVVTATADTSPHNNVYTLTQTVVGKRQVLLVTERQADVDEIRTLYGTDAEIDAYLISGRHRDVPYTVEALSQYDEIILSNVDIRGIHNVGAFVDSVDIVVSKFGKSLITLGDLAMQNKDDEVFEKLEELLPVSFGNANKDEKLFTLILDLSSAELPFML